MLNLKISVMFQGCQPCNCDPVGSLNHTCDLYTGQCQCRPGVTGQRCDVCQPYQYGFSLVGCKPCECDQIGSLALQCDPLGQCPVSRVKHIKCDVYVTKNKILCT